MKAVIILTLILIAITLGHDAWISYDKDLPFALSDFGWLVTNYVPGMEQYIIDNISPDDQARFISPIFNLETLWVICVLMGLILAITSFFKLSDNMGEISVFKGKKQEQTTSVRKRDQGKRMQYKRK